MKRITATIAFGFALSFFATTSQSQQSETFTRKELNALSPQDAATRIFGHVAGKVMTVKQQEFFSPTPVKAPQPWLMEIWLKPYYEDYSGLCRFDMLEANFEPTVSADTATDPGSPVNYDPPAILTAIDLTNYYAEPSGIAAGDKPVCSADLKNYFNASNGPNAAIALSAFRLFREAMAKARRELPISCERMKTADLCNDPIDKVLKNTTTLVGVEYVTLGPGSEETVGLFTRGDGPESPAVAIRLSLQNSKLTDIKLIADALEPPEMPIVPTP